jgi:hypothetical protein
MSSPRRSGEALLLALFSSSMTACMKATASGAETKAGRLSILKVLGPNPSMPMPIF